MLSNSRAAATSESGLVQVFCLGKKRKGQQNGQQNGGWGAPRAPLRVVWVLSAHMSALFETAAAALPPDPMSACSQQGVDAGGEGQLNCRRHDFQNSTGRACGASARTGWPRFATSRHFPSPRRGGIVMEANWGDLATGSRGFANIGPAASAPASASSRWRARRCRVQSRR
jgi:hypothetical protein